MSGGNPNKENGEGAGKPPDEKKDVVGDPRAMPPVFGGKKTSSNPTEAATSSSQRASTSSFVGGSVDPKPKCDDAERAKMKERLEGLFGAGVANNWYKNGGPVPSIKELYEMELKNTRMSNFPWSGKEDGQGTSKLSHVGGHLDPKPMYNDAERAKKKEKMASIFGEEAAEYWWKCGGPELDIEKYRQEVASRVSKSLSTGLPAEGPSFEVNWRKGGGAGAFVESDDENDDSESCHSDYPELSKTNRNAEIRLVNLYGGTDAGQFVWSCLDDAVKEGQQARCDASGTLHVFKDARFCLLDVNSVEMVEARYPELKNNAGRFIDEEDEKDMNIFIDLPTPIDIRKWGHAKTIEVHLSPKKEYTNTRLPLVLQMKYVCQIEDGKRVLARCRERSAAATFEDINSFYELKGFYKLFPTNMVRSAIQQAWSTVMECAAGNVDAEGKRACNPKLINVLVGGPTSVASELTEELATQGRGEEYWSRHPIMEELNEEQKTAVLKIITQRLTFVQGPPGTGKTFVLAAAIAILLLWSKGNRILVVTSSHSAADVVFFKVQRWLEKYAAGGQWIGEIARYMTKKASRETSVDEAFVMRDYVGQDGRIRHLKRIAKMQLLVAVVGGMKAKRLCKFFLPTMCLIDECSTVPKYMTPILLSSGGNQMAFVGDDMQLPSVTHVKSLGESEMTRWRKRGGSIIMLKKQFRMQSKICDVVSDFFYGGKLESLVSDENREPKVPIPHYDEDFPIAMIDVQSQEVLGGIDTKSITNPEQTNAATSVVLSLRENLMMGERVFVLCSYDRQKQDCMGALSLLLEQFPNLRVRTIDDAQGDEAEIVVVVTTRCNVTGILGHTGDDRRINVALSRARNALIVIGDVRTLTANDTWKKFLSRCEAKRSVYELSWGHKQLHGAYENARGVSIQAKLNDPQAHTVVISNVFFKWNFGHLVDQLKNQWRITVTSYANAAIPETQAGLYKGGKSGRFAVACDPKSYADLVALQTAKLRDPTRKGDDAAKERKFLFLPYRLAEVNLSFWKSDVVVARGFLHVEHMANLKIMLGNVFAGLTIRYIDLMDGGNEARLLFATPEEANCAVKKNGSWHSMVTTAGWLKKRMIEVWLLQDTDLVNDLKRKAEVAGLLFE